MLWLPQNFSIANDRFSRSHFRLKIMISLINLNYVYLQLMACCTNARMLLVIGKKLISY